MIKCVDAYKNLNIVRQNHVVQISPCCLSPTQTVKTIDFYNNEYLAQVRQSWSTGQWPKACEACQQSEQAGMISRRQGSNQWYKDHDLDNDSVELRRIDYWTGDQCNLACAICGPDWSSGWKQELGFAREEQRVIVNQSWQDLDLGQLKFVHFNGGEPLMSKEHVRFLEAIPNPAQVHINYNTNGTIKPTAELLTLWSKFQLVQLDFSIDDVAERFEFQRYPARWADVCENLQWFVNHAPHNCIFSVNTAVGILNYDNLTQLKSWIQANFATNRYGDPVEHRQQPVFGLLSLENLQKRPQQIRKFLDELDQRRGTNWRQIFPKLQVQLDSDK